MSTAQLTPNTGEAARERDLGPDFAEVYRENLTKVWRYVRARVPDHAEAHDVTSDIFVRAWRAWDRFDPGRGPVEPWLFTIAARAITDWYRRRRPEPVDTSMVVDLGGDHGPGPEAAALQEELLVQLAAAMDQLSEREREGLALRFAARLSSTNVARVLGMSPDAAKQMVHRAIAKLREASLDEQVVRFSAVADLEGVIDDVLSRGHVAMNDSELHGLLVHLVAAHDAPVPMDLSQRVADCIACEAKSEVTDAEVADVSAGRRKKGTKRLAAGSLSWVVAYANVCLACSMPTLAWGLGMLGLGTLSVRIHELSLFTAPLIAYLTWRGIRRHGNSLGFKLALTGAVVLLVHATAHYVILGVYGTGALNALQSFLRPMYDNDLLFTGSDMLGGALVVVGALVHLSHTQRWRELEMREFKRAIAIDPI